MIDDLTLRDVVLKILYFDKIGVEGLRLDDKVDIRTLEKLILFKEEN
jgi:hypothetical protein|tara:strand:+ start:279 stop:419 length:141 start_codon:yes stop_codon:yes gene_type:complete